MPLRALRSARSGFAFSTPSPFGRWLVSTLRPFGLRLLASYRAAHARSRFALRLTSRRFSSAAEKRTTLSSCQAARLRQAAVLFDLAQAADAHPLDAGER